MGYPVINRTKAQRLADEIKKMQRSDIDPLAVLLDESEWIEERGRTEYDRSKIETSSIETRKGVAPQLKDKEKKAKDADANLECGMAVLLHAALKDFSIEAIQDPDFWRYLALFPFRWYLLAREPELQPQDFGGEVTKYDEKGDKRVSGTTMKYQLLLRTYLWGRCAFDANDKSGAPGTFYRRAKLTLGVENLSTIDVWHSHIIRVQMGQLGQIPLAFIDQIVDKPPMNTDQARELEKLVTRMKHGVMFDALEYPSAREIISELDPIARERAREVAAIKAEKNKNASALKKPKKTKEPT